ncbi:MAG: 1-acyl-sn-glycerol-3-phosphate acyltransferase [Phycisphaerales bacterium]|nr:1-acyl-sn-glycerol-3-phosphate acyltransferase [Phycisphaerales bacterium]
MSILWTILLVVGGFFALGLAVGAAYGRSRPQDPLGPFNGLAYLLGRWYAQTVHQLRVETDSGALDDLSGPLIVVCNHTAGVDPILVSLSLPTRVRWLMADDMRVRWMNWFWNWHGVIFIARNRHGRTGLRTARKHLHANGIIGIFPEGRIERPAHKLLPFAPGVGVLVKRTGARVLPVVIDGTPQADTAWNAIWTSSSSVVHYHSPIDYSDSDLSAAEIAEDIQRRFQDWTGWPVGTKRTRRSMAQLDPMLDDIMESAGLNADDSSLARRLA